MNRVGLILNSLIFFLLFTLKHIIEFRMNGYPWQGALCFELVMVSTLFSVIMYGVGEAVEWIKKNRDYL
jgi:hypothetical protein